MSTFGFISAQNYQTVFTDRAIYFNNGSSQESARFDSVYYNPTQLFPFTIVRQIDTDCFSPIEPSRLGRSVILRDNGYNEFITYTYDTLKIKTDALLNESWIFFRDSMYEVTATVSSITEESLFGVSDTVKNITLQFKDLNGVPVNHYFNSITIKLSKSYGLKQWFDFAIFPNYQSIASINLTGLTNPNMGLTNFTWLETFDFHPGDELHIYQRYYVDQTLSYIKSVKKYLSRVDLPNKITYLVDNEEVILSPDNSLYYTHDTINEFIYKYDEFDNILPGEPLFTDYGISFLHFSNTIKYFPNIETFWGELPCYFLINSYGIWDSEYYKGLGGPYFDYNNGVEISRKRTLVYYKKDGVSNGTPFNLLGVDNQMEIQQNFLLYPNPAIDQVTITFKNEGSFTFECYDLLGKLVQTEMITNSGQVINISSLKSGMYLYRIKNEGQVIQTGKLIRKQK